MKISTKTALVGGNLAAGIAAPAFAQDVAAAQHVLSHRPVRGDRHAAMNGQLDYMTMLNERDGGINGVRIDYRGVRDRLQHRKGRRVLREAKSEGAHRHAAMVDRHHAAGAAASTNVDKMPILAPGYGFSAMQDGKTFKWAFNPPTSYWDGASMILQGDLRTAISTASKARRSPSCTSTTPMARSRCRFLKRYAATHGFNLLPIPVGLKEMQNQSAQWLQIRRERPDFVIMWGWGAMNAGAITEAVKTRYPMNQFVGIWWSGHDGDLKLVGEKGKGYRALSWSLSNNECAGHAGHQEASSSMPASRSSTRRPASSTGCSTSAAC